MGRSSALLNLVFPFFLPTIGIVFALAFGMERDAAGVAALALFFAGAAALAMSKVAAFRAGRWLTFGPSTQDRTSRWLWWAACALMAIAVPFVLAALHAK